jgi:hypothetical protein
MCGEEERPLAPMWCTETMSLQLTDLTVHRDGPFRRSGNLKCCRDSSWHFQNQTNQTVTEGASFETKTGRALTRCTASLAPLPAVKTSLRHDFNLACLSWPRPTLWSPYPRPSFSVRLAFVVSDFTSVDTETGSSVLCMTFRPIAPSSSLSASIPSATTVVLRLCFFSLSAEDDVPVLFPQA